MDVSVASAAFVFLIPAFVVIAILIRLDSRGPVFFRQLRWGRDQKPFMVFKFRTMAQGSNADLQAVEADVRLTRLGALLRRTNLDELPQVLNVIRGDMSLVGPRCHPVNMVAGGVPYEVLIRNYHDRHCMRPGITGLAQVRGFRGPTTNPTAARLRIESDLEYIQHFNVWLDVKIIIGTLLKELRNGGTGS